MAFRLPRFFSLHLCSEQRGHRGAGKGDQRQRDGMGKPVAVAVLALGKGAQEVDDALQEEQAQRQDGAHLDDDRVHLPVGIVEREFHQRFGDAQVRR